MKLLRVTTAAVALLGLALLAWGSPVPATCDATTGATPDVSAVEAAPAAAAAPYRDCQAAESAAPADARLTYADLAFSQVPLGFVASQLYHVPQASQADCVQLPAAPGALLLTALGAFIAVSFNSRRFVLLMADQAICVTRQGLEALPRLAWVCEGLMDVYSMRGCALAAVRAGRYQSVPDTRFAGLLRKLAARDSDAASSLFAGSAHTDFSAAGIPLRRTAAFFFSGRLVSCPRCVDSLDRGGVRGLASRDSR